MPQLQYTALDALLLVSPYDEYFHCESCNEVLVAESDKFANQELGDGDDNARRRRHENLKDLLRKFEEQLKPLMYQLTRVEDCQFLNMEVFKHGKLEQMLLPDLPTETLSPTTLLNLLKALVLVELLCLLWERQRLMLLSLVLMKRERILNLRMQMNL